MIEGIIRETFREFINHYEGIEINRMRLEFLEQQLLEKINDMYKKLEIKQLTCEDGAYIEGLYSTKDKLLGEDNK